MNNFILGDKKISFPSSWHEVSTGQFIQIRNNKSEFCKILSIFSGIDEKLFFDAEITGVALLQIIESLSWLQQPFDFNHIIKPNVITIDGKTVSIPDNLAIKTLGQKIYFEQRIFPMLETSEQDISIKPESIPIALAIYLQPQYTQKKFDPDTIEGFVKQCSEIPITTAYSLANFFLKKYFGLENLKQHLKPSPNQTMNRPESKSSASLVA